MYKNFTKQRKWRFLMRVSFAYLFLLIGGIQLLSASNSRGQGLEDIMVFIEVNEGNLESLLKRIEHQTPLTFAYLPSDVQKYNHVTLKPGRQTVKFALDQALENTVLSYRSIENSVIIFPKQTSNKSTDNLIASDQNSSIGLLNQERSRLGKIEKAVDALASYNPIELYNKRLVLNITGQVTDVYGEPLIGVNILVKGTNKGTTTDFDGRFSINDVDDQAVLVLSYIGYQSQEVAVGGQTSLTIIMQEDVQTLDEVVVVGYGTQKKVNVTGSISSIKTEDIDNIPMANLSNGLAGRAPGVQVVGTSGLAGASSSIRIRGSFAEPLYVIDGIIKNKDDFDALDPNEVENVSFLKDAASASIYGSSAGNGVVLVTTKSGSIQKPQFQYKGSYSASNPTQPIQDFSAVEELQYVNNTAVTKGQPKPYGEEVLNYFDNRSYGINELIWQTPTVQQHNLSVDGGSQDVKYYLSLGYHTEEGSYKNLGYEKYNFRSNISANISENLNVELNVSGHQRDYNRWYWPYDGAEDFDVSDFYRSTFNWTRLYPFYVDAAGNPTNDPNDIPVKPAGGWHPPALMLNEGGYRDTKYRNFDGLLKFNLDLNSLLDGLSTTVQGSLGAFDRNMKSFVVHNKYYIFQTASATNQFIPGPVDFTQTGSHNLSSSYENVQENLNLSTSYQFNWFLNYQKEFNRSDVSAMAVFEQAGIKSKAINGQAGDLLSSSIDQIYNASGDTERRWFSGGESQFARASWIGRVNYSFDQKYLAEFSFRYDGNYKFAPDQRWGFFPSGSLGWRLSEEAFMGNISWLGDLKLRASYGTTGSDSGIDPWRWSQVYSKSGGYVFGSSLVDGLVPGSVPNPNLTWSTVSLWDVGLEFGVINNKLFGEFDIWGKTESDILGTRLGSTPTTYGASLPAVNYAQRSWKGFELVLDWRDQLGDFDYSVYGNMGFAKDQWDIYDEAESLTDGTYQDNWRSRIGKPNNRVGGYIAEGIIRTQDELNAIPEGFTQFGRDPQIGTILFKDIRGQNYSEGPDGKIDENDWTYLSDNGRPRINFGIGFRFSWHNFSVNSHFQGVGAYDRMISTRDGGGVFQVDRPYFEIWARDYWTPESPNARYPRVAGNWMQPEFGGGPSSFWMRNGAYIRLKNLNLEYSIPGQWIENIGLSAIKFYGNATNLFVLTEMDEQDPEQATLDSYPLMKTFTGGLIVKF